MDISKSKAIAHIYSRLPYSDQIKNLDIDSEANAVRFDWRSHRFRVSFNYSYSVEEVGNGVLMGSDIAILLRYILNSQL